VWGDAYQVCAPHSMYRRQRYGGYGWRLSTKTRYIPCECVAYAWPHRPGGGICRWPDAPEYQRTTPAGTHSWPRVRGETKRLERILSRLWD
jgi:hypothetical protein